MLFVGLISLDLPNGKKLSKFSRIFMFFFIVSLNLLDADIIYHFDVHRSTASRNFHLVLEIMVNKLKFLIHWPDRETLQLTMPTSFRECF